LTTPQKQRQKREKKKSLPPNYSQNLTKVDLHRYDESWEREALEVLPHFYGSSRPLAQSLLSEIVLQPQNRVLDLRQAGDFHAWHLPGSLNVPLSSVGPHTPSPFSDPALLEAQWVELEKIFKDDVLVSDLGRHHVLVVCYDGDSARVATSVLRAKGVEADSVRGGHRALQMYEIGNESLVSTKVPLRTTSVAVPLE
jgi:rhodanese-related sulfurtransferase